MNTNRKRRDIGKGFPSFCAVFYVFSRTLSFILLLQVMSTILKHLTAGLPQLNLDSKTRTPAVAFGAAENEHLVIIRQGELLQVHLYA